MARVLNDIALSSDKAAALDAAQQARPTLADWPAAHYGYRERDVREVVSLLDEAISDLRASAGLNNFAVSLVAVPEPPGFEPLLGMPSVAEEIDQAFHVAALTANVARPRGAPAGRARDAERSPAPRWRRDDVEPPSPDRRGSDSCRDGDRRSGTPP